MQKDLALLRAIPGRLGPLHAEVKICDRLIELYHREELLWRQRARIEWLASGDKNTYYFHMRASRRRRKNQIKAFQLPDGRVTENIHGMEDFATDFYKNLYTSEEVHDMDRVLDTVPTKVRS